MIFLGAKLTAKSLCYDWRGGLHDQRRKIQEIGWMTKGSLVGLDKNKQTIFVKIPNGKQISIIVTKNSQIKQIRKNIND